jgi:hypothetical protein
MSSFTKPEGVWTYESTPPNCIPFHFFDPIQKFMQNITSFVVACFINKNSSRLT